MPRYVRRVQQIGSSLLVSLPREWVKRNDLKKGSSVPIEVNRDNSISIFSSSDVAERSKEASLRYTSTGMDSLVNQIYGAYLLGYDIIRVRAESPISFEDGERIKQAIRKLVGLEIVDEDALNLSAQFLLDAATLDAEKILRRMGSIVAGMFRDVVDATRQGKASSIRKAIESRDAEVNRQYFLLVRLIRSAMMDQRLADKLNLSNIDILDYRIAANLLESAGDYIVELGTGKGVPRAGPTRKLLEAAALVTEMQEKSVAAFVSRNRADSLSVVKAYGQFAQILNSVKEMSASAPHDKEGTESTIAVLNAAYSLDKIARCWVDVADLVKPVHLVAPLQQHG